MNEQIQAFEAALLSMDRVRARALLVEFSNDREFIHSVEELVVPTLERIGLKWEEGEVPLAQVYMSGRICEELVDQFLPPSAPERSDTPSMAICVLEDFHTLGKLIVYSALRASGIELLDLRQVNVDEAVKQVIEHDIQILLVSVLMYPSALRITQLIERLKTEHPSTRVIVGGAPFRFDLELWKQVGADGWGATFADALRETRKMMELQP